MLRIAFAWTLVELYILTRPACDNDEETKMDASKATFSLNKDSVPTDNEQEEELGQAVKEHDSTIPEKSQDDPPTLTSSHALPTWDKVEM